VQGDKTGSLQVLLRGTVKYVTDYLRPPSSVTLAYQVGTQGPYTTMWTD